MWFKWETLPTFSCDGIKWNQEWKRIAFEFLQDFSLGFHEKKPIPTHQLFAHGILGNIARSPEVDNYNLDTCVPIFFSFCFLVFVLNIFSFVSPPCRAYLSTKSTKSPKLSKENAIHPDFRPNFEIGYPPFLSLLGEDKDIATIRSARWTPVLGMSMI